jgi:hypothetical protein
MMKKINNKNAAIKFGDWLLRGKRQHKITVDYFSGLSEMTGVNLLKKMMFQIQAIFMLLFFLYYFQNIIHISTIFTKNSLIFLWINAILFA